MPKEFIRKGQNVARHWAGNRLGIAWSIVGCGETAGQSVHRLMNGDIKEGLIIAVVTTGYVGVTTWRYALRLKEMGFLFNEKLNHQK